MNIFRPIAKGSTSQSVIIRVLDASDGTPEQGVEHDTGGVSLWYRRDGAAVVAITPAALAGADSAYSVGGIEHLDDGYYRLDVPNAAFVTGVSGVMIGGAFTDMVVVGVYVPLVEDYPQVNTMKWAGEIVATDVTTNKPEVSVNDFLGQVINATTHDFWGLLKRAAASLGR